MSKHCAHCGKLIPRPANMHGSNYHRAKFCSKRCGWDAKFKSLDEALSSSVRDEKKGCLLWTRGLNSKGYPTISYGGKPTLVTRLVLSRKLGRPLLASELACHSCDTPACIEAGHLWPGSMSDNINDCVAKGRHKHGEVRGTEHPLARLTDDSAREIFLNKDGLIAREQAGRYGVSIATIYDIRHRKKWKHATDGLEVAR